jgi:hypothetical protein
MMSILIGIVCIIVGFAMVLKPRWFLAMIGEQAWSIKVFGHGHGTTAYQTIGIIVILVGFLLMFGFFPKIITSIFSSILPTA